jgi:hypothetical protein
VQPALAANGSAYIALRAPDTTAASAIQLPPESQGFLDSLDTLFDFNVLKVDTMAALAVDRSRPVVVSFGIVDAELVDGLFASTEPPTGEVPLAIRFFVTVPTEDLQTAEAALQRMADKPTCGRPGGDSGRWSAWLKKLENPSDRRAARAANASLICLSKVALVARLDRSRREVQWVAAHAVGSSVAAALAPVPSAPAMVARLERLGFFSARVAFYTTPVDLARNVMAMGAFGPIAIVAGVEASLRRQLWNSGMQEVAGLGRLVESGPRLFSDYLVLDGAVSWGLTPEGQALFSSLRLPAGTNVRGLLTAVERQVKPGGVFASPQTLTDTVRRVGADRCLLPANLFLWPHLAAFAKAHPGERPVLPVGLTDHSATVELDSKQARLRLRRK